MSEKKKSGFTLVELMVAMSIVAVLIGLSVFGISTAQRNLRDNQRRDAVTSLATALADYYTNNNQYPTSTTFSALNTLLKTPVLGVTTAAQTTTANGTSYCYAVASDGYILGALLESGVWFSLSSSATKCSATYKIAP
jgi:prepilin-type N-terminal cleavage/methylation domain-containing protein